jgi:uncharacterized protein
MKVVLDTNTLFVSVSDRSSYYPIYLALQEGFYELVLTTDILLEYEEVIGDEMGADIAADLVEFLSLASNIHRITRYYKWYLIVSDPDDDKFVDAAVAGNVDFIVTDDRHFRVLKNVNYPKIKTISTEEFLEIAKQFLAARIIN